MKKLETHLSTLDAAVCDNEDGGVSLVSWDLELSEGGSVSVEDLTHLLVDRVQLDLASHAAVNRTDANEHKPLEVGIHTVVDDLGPSKSGVAVKHLDRVVAACAAIRM